jgi:hypothetical protein
MWDWIQKAYELKAKSEPFATVTIIRVSGSAPRDVGAKMIVSNGEVFGTIGGGNLEHLAIISAWTVSPILAFYTLLVFLAIHQLESHVLVPLLTRRSVGLHPVLVIIALLIGLELGGLLGAFVAVPAAAVIQEVVEFRSARRHLPNEEEME